jgi:hypothetical protein
VGERSDGIEGPEVELVDLVVGQVELRQVVQVLERLVCKKVAAALNCGEKMNFWDRCYAYEEYFRQKNLAKQLALFVQNTASFCKK